MYDASLFYALLFSVVHTGLFLDLALSNAGIQIERKWSNTLQCQDGKCILRKFVFEILLV